MSPLRVGLIGCGSFARGLYLGKRPPDAKWQIHACHDLDEAAAQEFAEQAGAEYATTDLDRLLADPAVDVVFISTRHDSHAALTIAAAAAGKHVLCEKPMALNREECRAITAAVRKTGVKYTVGYNRGLAPLVAEAQAALADLPDKRLIYHRIQADFPASHWTHDPAVGGGRFVGEGCHIFDLLCELVPAPPVSVYAAGGTFLDPEQVHIPDSAIITLSFADGSVATTLIASAGCPAFPKEATEVYCAGRAIYINDFREMELCRFRGQETIRIELGAQDKGHARELRDFADAVLNDTEPPNGLVQAARAAVISYLVNESLAAGTPLPITEQDYTF